MSEQAYSGSRAWSWRHAIAMSGLPAMTRHVLLTLSLRMDETGGSCFPSVSDLVEMTGLDKKTVLKHLDNAEKAGWIEISQHGFRGQKWKRNEYSARWPGRDGASATVNGNDRSSVERGGATPPPFDEKVVEMVPEGGGNGSRKVVEQLHQDKILPTNIPDNIPDGIPAPARRGAVAAELSVVLDDEHVRAVIEHRKAIRKPLTPHAAKLLARRFAVMPDPNAAADSMIGNGWQGFEPEWLDNRNRRSSARSPPGKAPQKTTHQLRQEAALAACDARIFGESHGRNAQPEDRHGSRADIDLGPGDYRAE